MAEAAVQQDNQETRKGGSVLGIAILAIVLIYLAGFAILVIDSLFFADGLWNLLPLAMQDDVRALVQTVYAPLIWVLGLMI